MNGFTMSLHKGNYSEGGYSPNSPLSPTLRQRLYGHLALARISNSPTVVSNALAGAALAGVVWINGPILLVAAATALLYTAGMYLNDLCDYAVDCQERPERPLPSGLISRTEAAVVVGLLFLISALLLWLVGTASFWAGLVLISLIVLYDMWHKTNPLSPLIMAGCRLMVYMIAYLAFASIFTVDLVVAGALLVLYIMGLTYIAKNEARAHRFRQSGRQIGNLVARFWPAVALFLPALYFPWQSLSLLTLALLVLFVAWVIYSISFVYRAHPSIGGAIARLIAGISLYDGLVLTSVGAMPGVGVALLAFGLTLFFQRYIKGT